jgi:DNA ligase (NAD+)
LLGKLCKLSDFGFTIVPTRRDISNYDIEKVIKNIQLDCQKLEYPIDGVVFKYNKCSEYDAAGRTDHHFKGGLAYKFYDEEYPTYLRDIEWTMGRTGKLSPVAIFDTVDIDGTEVSRANLHNISVMEETLHGTGWRGQPVSVAKMNMIIPQIMSASSEKPANEDDYLLAPITCPICDGVVEIIQDNESKVLYCTNPNCEGKLINRIDHFFGKKGLDAKGISKATIEKLIDWGWVNGIKDMFTLDAHAEDWKKKAGFGEKSVNNIITSIRESSNIDLESIISAAGIPLIGRTVARQIASIFNTYEDFREAIGSFDFSNLDGFGYEMNKSLKNFDFNELDYIVENYLTIQNKIEANNNNKKLENLTFCITGKITNWKNRDELVKYIEDFGGKCVGSVSANVNYLINNDIESTSAKNKKAKELNIEIINEQTFIKKFDLQK